jgi:hypothetical protein
MAFGGEASSALHRVLSSSKPLLSNLASLDKDGAENWLGSLDTKKQIDLLANVKGTGRSLVRLNRVLTRYEHTNLRFGIGQKVLLVKPKLQSAIAGIGVARRLGSVFLPILANEKPRTWFIANQNLAESRGTGGILGSFAIVKVAGGKAELLLAGSDQDLDKLGPVNFSALPDDLRNAWGVEPANWRDLNASRHFGYFAQQISDTFAPKVKLDGVVAIGQGTVEDLIAATGPIKVDGVELNSQTARDFLATGVYARFENVRQKNNWLQKLIVALFAKLKKSELNIPALWDHLQQQSYPSDALGWSKDARVQQVFEAENVSGSVKQKMGPDVYVSLNNGAANKLDAYLEVQTSYQLSACGQTTVFGLQGREASVSVNFTNKAPSGLPKYVAAVNPSYVGVKYKTGTNRTLVSIYAPIGASQKNFTLGSEPIFASEAFDRGHPVWTFDLLLAPGKSQTLVLNWIEPIADSTNEDIQTRPHLVAPLTFVPTKTSVKTSGTCKVIGQ